MPRYALALLFAALAACGDPPLAAAPADAAAVASEVSFSGDLTVHDSADAPAAAETADGADTSAETAAVDAVDVADAAPADTEAPDVPADAADAVAAPFAFASHTPATGAVDVPQPVTFTLVFNAPVKADSAYKATIEVTCHGTLVPGTFKTEGDKVHFAADGPVPAASRVQVTLSPLVQDLVGGSLGKSQSFHFYTPPLPDLAPYAQLAARYAPTIRQGLSSFGAEHDLLRSLDHDGDWDAANNAQALPTNALARVGWSVIETPSHWFVGYVYFWPRRPVVTGKVGFDNDIAGSMVVVARHPQEAPVALLTYFKTKADEQMWAWVTQESGLLPAGKQPKDVGLRAVLPLAKLFPKPADPSDVFGCEGQAGCVPRRFPAFLTADSHQSCLWLDAGDASFQQCVKTPASQDLLKTLDYVPVASPLPVGIPNAGSLPNAGGATYGLQSLHGVWWPHRDEAGPGRLFEDATFVYVPPAGRPGAGKPGTGSKFLGGGADFGRPPWAWQWKPATGVTYYQMPRGTPWLDPPYALAMRLGATLPAWDLAKKTGYSQEFCLHPYFLIDLRGTPACPPGP